MYPLTTINAYYHSTVTGITEHHIVPSCRVSVGLLGMTLSMYLTGECVILNDPKLYCSMNVMNLCDKNFSYKTKQD